ARISADSLDINYAALIHRQPFLNALDVRDAQITLPLKTEGGKADKAQLTNFRAHVYFPPEQIYVSQAEAIFCGIRISATGQLISARITSRHRRFRQKNGKDGYRLRSAY